MMSKKKAMQVLKNFGEEYNCRILFCNMKWAAGTAHLDTNTIYISTHQKIKTWFFTACHEVQHILNKRNGKYKIFHNCKRPQWQDKYALATALRAEMYTDKQALILLKRHFPGCKAYGRYNKSDGPKIRQYMKGYK